MAGDLEGGVSDPVLRTLVHCSNDAFSPRPHEAGFDASKWSGSAYCGDLRKVLQAVQVLNSKVALLGPVGIAASAVAGPAIDSTRFGRRGGILVGLIGLVVAAALFYYATLQNASDGAGGGGARADATPLVYAAGAVGFATGAFKDPSFAAMVNDLLRNNGECTPSSIGVHLSALKMFGVAAQLAGQVVVIIIAGLYLEDYSQVMLGFLVVAAATLLATAACMSETLVVKTDQAEGQEEQQEKKQQQELDVLEGGLYEIKIGAEDAGQEKSGKADNSSSSSSSSCSNGSSSNTYRLRTDKFMWGMCLVLFLYIFGNGCKWAVNATFKRVVLGFTPVKEQVVPLVLILVKLCGIWLNARLAAAPRVGPHRVLAASLAASVALQLLTGLAAPLDPSRAVYWVVTGLTGVVSPCVGISAVTVLSARAPQRLQGTVNAGYSVLWLAGATAGTQFGTYFLLGYPLHGAGLRAGVPYDVVAAVVAGALLVYECVCMRQLRSERAAAAVMATGTGTTPEAVGGAVAKLAAADPAAASAQCAV